MTLEIIPEVTIRTNGRPRRITVRVTSRSTASCAVATWCDLKVEDGTAGCDVKAGAIIIQQKTKRPVQFEITEHTRTLRQSRFRRLWGRKLRK